MHVERMHLECTHCRRPAQARRSPPIPHPHPHPHPHPNPTQGEALSTLTFWLDAVRKQAEACAVQLRATPAG